jgi:hypothetical protein
MLNSCAGGVAVVNIDNGFGAAAIAQRIVLRCVASAQAGHAAGERADADREPAAQAAEEEGAS